MSGNEQPLKAICRLCDAHNVPMHSVFAKASGGKQVLQLIKDYLPILIYRTDPLSKQICDVCYTRLNQFHVFKQTAIAHFQQQKDQLLAADTSSISVQLFLNTLNSDHMSCEPLDDSFNNHQNDGAIHILSSDDEEMLMDHSDDETMPIRENGIDETANKAQKRLADNPELPDQKKRRLTTTQSLKEPPAPPKRLCTYFAPVSLLKACLNAINRTFIPDYTAEYYEKTVVEEPAQAICTVCNAEFDSMGDLAKHGSDHVTTGGETVVKRRRLRCKAFAKLQNDVQMKREPRAHAQHEVKREKVERAHKGAKQHEAWLEETKVRLVDETPVVNGIPLADIPKEERRDLYKSVTVEGLKRKYCPLCRYIFKDNWSIELHYFTSVCYYTCEFCGFRFNSARHRPDYESHMRAHHKAGDTPMTGHVFVSRRGFDKARLVHVSKVAARTAMRAHGGRWGKKKQEVEEEEEEEVVEEEEKVVEKKEEGENRTRSAAYFCRKCYKVFFELDVYNVHVISCKAAVKTAAPRNNNNAAQATPPPPPATPNTRARKSHSGGHDDEGAGLLSPSGRPIRHCVKEQGAYLDDTPEEVLERMRRPQKLFPCTRCNSSFSTVYSRNSHMRVHKEAMLAERSVTIQRRAKRTNVAKKVAGLMEKTRRRAHAYDFSGDVRVKQEEPMMEPLVEIHEEAGNHYPTNIGSVSITPIPNANKRTNLDPSIMKLVQNNPNLTIKTMEKRRQQMQQQAGGGATGGPDEKVFKCSGCEKPFLNKSLLYQHKKNNCGGSKYPCPFCKKRFGTEGAYSSHIYYNHAE